ncbi:hypothetical protein EP7_004642 [Isosphaeraceae bacterium EP7]
MEVSPTGQNGVVGNPNDPVTLLHMMLNLQSQSLELQRQGLEMQRQQLDLAREAAQVARDQRTRQVAELEKWQTAHDSTIDSCRDALGKLEQVHSSLMGDLAEFVDENHENLVDGDFALSDFVDRFGPRLAHLNTMLAVLRPLAVNMKRSES